MLSESEIVTLIGVPQLLLEVLASVLIGMFLAYLKLGPPKNRRIEGLVRLTADLRARLTQLRRDADEARESYQQEKESAEQLRIDML